MKEKRFITKRGRLTDYALSCGYIDVKNTTNYGRIMLWKSYTNQYNVTSHYNTSSFRTLTEARKYFAGFKGWYAKNEVLL